MGRNDSVLMVGLTVALFVIFSGPVAHLLDYVREFSDDSAHVREAILIANTLRRLERVQKAGGVAFRDSEEQCQEAIRKLLKLIDDINADEGVRWLFSFLSADQRRTYCLYEAPSPDAILTAARRANVPADEVVEVGGAASPELVPRLRDWTASQAEA